MPSSNDKTIAESVSTEPVPSSQSQGEATLGGDDDAETRTIARPDAAPVYSEGAKPTPPQTASQDDDRTLAGDLPDSGDGKTLAGELPDQDTEATLAGDLPARDDDRTLAGDIPNQDHEATLGGELAARDNDRTLVGDHADGRDDKILAGEIPNQDDAKTLGGELPPLDNDRTLLGDQPDSRGAKTLASDHPDQDHDATLVADAGRGNNEPTLGGGVANRDSELTVREQVAFRDETPTMGADGVQRNEVDADATFVQADDSHPPDERTMIQEEFGDSRSAASRKSYGPTFAMPGPAAADQRTIIGESESRGRPVGGDEGTIVVEGRQQPQPEAEQPHSDQARYDLVNNFAKGGLGKIWLARDKRIQRDVAYKEVLPAALKNKNYLERFLEEAQITGQLEHPGIVPIYDLGWQDNGTPFYAMKLVRGKEYKKAIEEYHAIPRESSERKLAFVTLLRNFIEICNALAFAHDRGVVHRDLKPQNVMLGSFGETLVLDWGLAKIVGTPERASDEEGGDGDDQNTSESVSRPGGSFRQTVTSNVRSQGSQTVMGSVMGTPAYMPPEQARGQLQDIDARSDIYSLGAILYEVLTSKPPIAKGKIQEMLQRVIEGEIPPPRSLDTTIPKPLEAICLKALSRERPDRYQNALHLARDVERWLADEPIDVYLEPWPLRLKRWVRRHRTLVTSGALSVLALAVVCGAWMVTERVRLQRMRVRVQAAVEESRKSTAAGDFEQSKAQLNEALGIIRTEPALAEREIDIQDRLEQVDHELAARETLRVEKVRAKAVQKIAEAQMASDRQDVDNAANMLTEVAATLKGESSLQDLKRDADRRLAVAKQEIAKRNAANAAKEAVNAAQARFVQFQHSTDRARFFASNFTGDRVRNNAEQAQKAALACLQMYGLDQSANGAIAAPHLSAEQVAEIKSDAYELMLILAETGSILANNEPAADRKKAWETSLNWVERARLFGVTSRILRLQESQYFALLGRDAEAEQARAAANEIKPATPLEFFLLAENERKAGRYGPAALLYQQALSLDPNYFLALYSLGVCNLQRVQTADVSAGNGPTDFSGYLSAAVTAFTTCLAQRPDFPWPYILRGIAYADMGNFDEAFADFQHALDAKVDATGVYDPDLYKYGILMNQGVVLLKQGRLREAEASFRQAMQLRPDSADPHINLAVVLSTQKKDKVALDELTEAARLDPRLSKIYRLRADANLRLKDDDAAIRDFEQAIETETNVKAKAPLYFEIGKIYHRAKHWSEAVAVFDQSLVIDPDNADVNRLRGEALLPLKRDDEAIAAFSRYLLLAKKPAGDAYRSRGVANAAQRHYRAAINDYTRSLELEPSPNMLTRRGWAYLLQAQQLALEDFDEAIKLNPDNGDSYNGRGYARVLLGDYVAAVTDAEEAVKHGPVAFEIYYNAATIYAQTLPHARKDAKLTDEKRKQLTTDYTRRALELIREAGKALGPKNLPLLLKTLEADPAIDPLRDTPEYKTLVEELGAKRPN